MKFSIYIEQNAKGIAVNEKAAGRIETRIRKALRKEFPFFNPRVLRALGVRAAAGGKG